MQATLEQMDNLRGTSLYKLQLKYMMNKLEVLLERTLKNPLNSLDKEDPDLLTRIQSNIELVMGMDLEELAMLRAEIDEYRENNETFNTNDVK